MIIKYPSKRGDEEGKRKNGKEYEHMLHNIMEGVGGIDLLQSN